MSVKRRATTDLNHENWDQEEKDEEEMGTFKVAPEDVLEKRVIKIAKRRSQNADGTKKAVFSGFGGFNKTQPSSFDFLANLTNGSKTNTSSATTTDSVTPSTNITIKPFGSMSSSNIFTSPASSVPAKPSFGKPTTESSSVFGVPTSSIAQSIFTASKADSTVNDNPFKTQVTTNSFNSKQPEVSSSQVSSTIFGTASSSSNNKSLFAPSSSTAFQIQPVSSASSQLTNTAVDAKTENKKESNTNSEKIEAKKLTYYSKLKGLNESVSEWIKKHVDETPLCILTPIFKDYEKYLKEIQDEYNNKKEEKNSNNNDSKTTENQAAPIKSDTTPTTNMLASPSFTTASPNTPKSIFAVRSTQSGNFSFGFTSSASTNTSAGFSFLNSTQSTATTTSPFAGSNSAANTNDKPFSFGTNKPFNFNSNIQVKENTDKPSENNEEEDEPPKVEFTPVVEENSVFDKRCKIFVKKDGNFVDKGVGTLYIKKIEDSEKHQLLVRANTNLGNVLLNMVLSSAIPIQRMGKNNVMLVCIPSPEAKPPPVPILIRVKTSEEADDLLNTLNKYKQ